MTSKTSSSSKLHCELLVREGHCIERKWIKDDRTLSSGKATDTHFNSLTLNTHIMKIAKFYFHRAQVLGICLALSMIVYYIINLII